MKRRRHLIAWDHFEKRELLSGVPSNGPEPSAVVNYLLSPDGQPSAHQYHKLQFRAFFRGPFTMGPGRYSTEANQIYIRGVGTSNQFLHGDVQLRIITPTDPTIPQAGASTSFDKNINSNSTLGLLVQADPTSLDKAGRPTRLVIYSADPNTSAGQYVESQATGTINVTYHPQASPSKPGLTSTGIATLSINAQIYTLGTSFALRNAQLYNAGPKK